MKTSTISFRVPNEFKEQIASICKQQGISMTDYCLTNLAPNKSLAPVKADVIHKLEKGGLVNNVSSAFEIPTEMSNVLSTTGGLLVGLVCYRALKENLQMNNPDWTNEKLEGISIAAGLASAILSGLALKGIMSK